MIAKDITKAFALIVMSEITRHTQSAGEKPDAQQARSTTVLMYLEPRFFLLYEGSLGHTNNQNGAEIVDSAIFDALSIFNRVVSVEVTL